MLSSIFMEKGDLCNIFPKEKLTEEKINVKKR